MYIHICIIYLLYIYIEHANMPKYKLYIVTYILHIDIYIYIYDIITYMYI